MIVTYAESIYISARSVNDMKYVHVTFVRMYTQLV